MLNSPGEGTTVGSQKVLCYGIDGVLQYTRLRILQQLGCSVSIVTDAKGYNSQLETECPHVIVLCQTLTLHEWHAAARLAAISCNKARILLMCTRGWTNRSGPKFSLLAAADGPAAFAEAASDLL